VPGCLAVTSCITWDGKGRGESVVKKRFRMIGRTYFAGTYWIAFNLGDINDVWLVDYFGPFEVSDKDRARQLFGRSLDFSKGVISHSEGR